MAERAGWLSVKTLVIAVITLLVVWWVVNLLIGSTAS